MHRCKIYVFFLLQLRLVAWEERYDEQATTNKATNKRHEQGSRTRATNKGHEQGPRTRATNKGHEQGPRTRATNNDTTLLNITKHNLINFTRVTQDQIKICVSKHNLLITAI